MTINFRFSNIINKSRKIYNHYLRARQIERSRFLLADLYRDINTFDISMRYRKEKCLTDSRYIYGEMMYSSFTNLMTIVQPCKGEIFYDLGCGDGKLVLAAALLYPDITARGIEYLPPLVEVCQRMADSLQHRMQTGDHYKHRPLNIEFLSGELLSVNFTDVNIIYLNVTCFDTESWHKIAEKLELLPLHARIIITSKQLGSKNFKLIHQQLYLMSWGLNTVSIFQKI